MGRDNLRAKLACCGRRVEKVTPRDDDTASTSLGSSGWVETRHLRFPRVGKNRRGPTREAHVAVARLWFNDQPSGLG